MTYARKQYSRKLEKSKLDELMESEGFDSIDDLADEAMHDSVVPSICMNAGCDYIIGMEPDQDAGYCECCDTNTVQSAFILMGVI
jgi:hypothetical protein